MRFKGLSWAAALAIGLQVAGCYTDYGQVVANPGPTAQTDVAIRLQPGEKIKVTVYGEEALSGLYDINPSGFITMPLAGTIQASGYTKAELEQVITGKYRGAYLHDPKVVVDVIEFRPIYVMGEAEKPGEYPYRSGLNVLTAVATAGGFTYRASKNTVLIQHAGQDAWQEYPLSASVLVAPGDLIRIPERYF